jgi:hypothetical protein
VLFKQWYGEGGAPMASPMSDIQFSQLKGSFRLRAMRSGLYSASTLSQMSGTSAPFDMMQAGVQMMQQMQQALQGSMQNSSASSSQQVPFMNFRRSPNSPVQIRPAMAIGNGGPPAMQMIGNGVPIAVEGSQAPLVPNPLLEVATASTPPAAQAAVVGATKVDEITKAVLDKMIAAKGAKQEAVAKEKAKAKGSKGTPKAKAKAKVLKEAQVLKDAKVLKKTAAADKGPPMPKLGPMTAINFLTCSRVWRIIEKSNTRKDYKISWNGGKAAWCQVLEKCRELSS